MKAAWVMLAAGVAVWASADISQARTHHKKKSATAASSSSSDSSSDAADAPATQQLLMPQASSSALPPAFVPNTTTTTQYDPAKGFPDHNGAFSAMLVVIPKSELPEFARPAGTGRHLDRVAKAEPGAQLAIKMVFVGVKPDCNANANVTYDLQVVGPDGRIYGHSDYKGLVAVQSRINPTPDDPGMYDNRQVVVMQFEPQDAIGLYKLRVVMHDNVAHLDLPLEAGVELLRKDAVAAATQAPAAPVTPVAPAAPAVPVMTVAPTPAPARVVAAAPAPAVSASSSASSADASSSSASSSSADASMAPIADDTPTTKKKRKHH